MADYFVLLLVVGTSLVGVAVGLAGRLPLRGLPRALGKTLEVVGLTILFAGINLFAGGSIVLLVRGLTGRFASLYVMNDVVLLVFSTLQALVSQAWWETREKTGS